MTMPGRGSTGSSGPHRCPRSRGPCLYELALREAIAAQHGLVADGRSELAECIDCGAPYLVQEVWQPLSEEGELACPHCGATVATWDGARSFVAYWLRSGQPIGAR
jgi:uncharacterized Zn-finger protein